MWQLSVDSLKAAVDNLSAPETLAFLDEFLLKMMSILLTQRYVGVIVSTAFPSIFLSLVQLYATTEILFYPPR
jgi:hypothetical protein